MPSPLQFYKKSEVAFLVLNRPEKCNALDPDLIQALTSVFKDIARDSSLRAVVLKGKGRAFCSGADLHWLQNEKQFNKKILTKLFSLLEQINSCPFPVIAQVQGFVIGGGLGLISVCDVVISEEKTRFQFSETKLALVPSIIIPFVLKKIPLSQARFFILTARAFSAAVARQTGLVHFAGSRSECSSFLKEILAQIKALDTYALKQSKEILSASAFIPPSKVKSFCVDKIHMARKKSSAKRRISQFIKPLLKENNK